MGGPSGLATPIFSFSLSSLEPKSLRMIILTVMLVQVLCCHSITKITRNGINGAMFVTISPFLVIDDNTIKASISLQKLTILTTWYQLKSIENRLRLLGCLPPSNDDLASPWNHDFPLCIPFILQLLPHDLIHLGISPPLGYASSPWENTLLWSTFLPLWNQIT